MTEPDAGAPAAGLKKTPLHELHLRLGARLVAFAGYEMPVHYAPGILKEHLYTRAAAGLFDVSHMGQIVLRARSGEIAEPARALETLVPVDVVGLAPGRQRYALFTNERGGILDDLMITNRGDHLLLVVNAARKEADEALLRAQLAGTCEVHRLERALLALQGPKAAAVLDALARGAAGMGFMEVRDLAILGHDCVVSRSGYTGEDGFEISVPLEAAVPVAEALLSHPDVQPIGLGARDSLRLEAGLPLYGSDLDEATTPVEAGLAWAISKARRTGGARAGGFPGADVILRQTEGSPQRRRVGFKPDGRQPVRGGSALFASIEGGEAIGTVTSGGFGPSAGVPISMGYVPASAAVPGTKLFADVRSKRTSVTVVPLPFVPHRYHRG